jgi:hypothetical protein
MKQIFKGKLVKVFDGWVVRHGSIKDSDLEISPHDLESHTIPKYDRQDVEFEIQEIILGGVNRQYAKLINTDVDKLGNDDVPKSGYDVEKELDEMGEPDDDFQQTYKVGFEEGYNKAKETLYTEEDMLDAFYEGWEAKGLIWREAKKQFKESIKEFKQ